MVMGGGGTISNTQHKMHTISSGGLDILVLQLGSNDLCNPKRTINITAKRLISLVDFLIFEYNIKKVVICQVLRRENTLEKVPDFNNLVVQLNN